MYHWKTELLANEIRNKTLSENEKFKYFLAYSLATVLSGSTFFQSEPVSQFDYADDAITFIAALIGYLYLYKVNANKGSFIERVICIGWPITVKLFAVSIIVGIAILAAPLTDIHERITLTGLLVLGEIYLFWRIGHWLKKIA